MAQKRALISLAAPSGVLFSMPGTITGLRMTRFALRTLAVLYHAVGSSLVLASESLDVPNDCLDALMALFTAFR